jgi:hypothetical protein
VSVTAAQPKVEVMEASRRDFSLKPNEAADTIIALAICRRDSFRGRAAGADTKQLFEPRRKYTKGLGFAIISA